MSYRVEISPDAQKEIAALSGYVRAPALKLLRSLKENPRPPRAKELRDKPNVYRLWLAKKWRIVYRVEEDRKQVLVLRVRLKELIDYESL
jgi:mRNA-degrading endonuclease RelE of RelBE toxin-antitoxin system